MKNASIVQHRYKLFTVGAIGTFMATLDGSIVNVALPTLARELGASVDLVAWVVLSYSLTLVSLMIAFGAWVSRKGYSFGYKFGFVFFTVGSLICALSHSIYPLIAGRVIQAIGTAMLAAMGPGMVTEVFPTQERGRGMGFMTMMVSAGLMTGPPLGGFLLSLWSWQSIFLINLPIGAIGLVFTFRYFKLLKPRTDRKMPPIRGSVAASVALLSAMVLTSIFSDFPLADFRIWGLALLGIMAVFVFYRSESNPATALLGPEIFHNRQFITSIVAMLCFFMAFSGVLVLVPFYLEQIKNLTPKTVGLFLMILPVSMFVTAPLSGRVSDRIGFRLLTSLGMIVLIGGLIMLSGLSAVTSTVYIIISLLLAGIGNGIFNTPNSSALMGSVTPPQRPVASGILGTTRNVGMSFGIALATGLFAFYHGRYLSFLGESDAFISAYHNIIYVSIVIAAVGIPFCLVRKNR